MISTIKKIPWYASEHISLEQRDAIYRSTEQLVTLLDGMLRAERDSHVLTYQLKRRLVDAALACPGFSVLQKDNIAYLDGRDDRDLGDFRRFDQPRMANKWTHQYTMVPKKDFPNDVIEWYIAMIREESSHFVMSLPIMDSQAVQAAGRTRELFWGYYWWELTQPQGPLPKYKPFLKMSLHDIARVELSVTEQILRRCFLRVVPFTL
jgi:hypothetical protein